MAEKRNAIREEEGAGVWSQIDAVGFMTSVLALLSALPPSGRGNWGALLICSDCASVWDSRPGLFDRCQIFFEKSAPALNGFLRGELRVQDVELRHREIVSSVAKRKMVWRIRGLDCVDDRDSDD